MEELIFTLLIILAGIWSSALLILCDEKDHSGYWYGTPKYFYERANMNLFGAIFSGAIMYILACPLYTILFLHWLCYVHRKENKNEEKFTN